MFEQIQGYHAHIYYEIETKSVAELVHDELAKAFPNAVLGRWHDKPVGPHPTGSIQVAFTPDLFGQIIPWLATHRQGLVILIHPESGDNLADHSDHAMWLGGMPKLNLEIFKNS